MGFWNTVGSAVGGVVGSVAGPLGTYVGSKVGDTVGGWVGDAADAVGDWAGGLFGGGDDAPIEAMELYKKIHAGNSSSLHGAGEQMSDEARAHDQIADDAHKLVNILEAGWTGDASDGARDKIRSYAKVASGVADALGTNSGNFTTQASTFDRLQSTMQPLADPPPERDFLDRLAPWDTDTEDAVRENNQRAQQNLKMFEAYDRQTSSNAESLRLDYGNPDGFIDDGKGEEEEWWKRKPIIEPRPYRPGENGEDDDRTGPGDQRALEEERRRREAEAEQRRKQYEDEAERRKREYEEEMRRRQREAEEEARRRQQETEERRRQMEEEARRRQQEAEERRRQMEEEMRRRRGEIPDSGTRAAGYNPSDLGGSGGGFGPGSGGGGAGGFGPGSGGGAGGVAAFGPGTGGGAGAGAGNLGAGKAAGVGGAAGMGGAAAARGGAGAGMGRGGAGMGGMMGGAGAGKGQGGEDKEHKRASFLQENDPNSLFGTDEKTVPPVIGE